MSDLYYLLEKHLNKFDWIDLSKNPSAIPFLEKHIDKINWNCLSLNPNAIKLLTENYDKINWSCLSSNPNAIELLKENLDKIDWEKLSSNPNAIGLLEQNIDKIDWFELSSNPNAIKLLTENYDKISWFYLYENPNGVELIKKRIEYEKKWFNTFFCKKINDTCWHYYLSKNPNSLELLQENINKIDWYGLYSNPNLNAFALLEQDLYLLSQSNLISLCLNPNPYAINILERFLDEYGYDTDDYDNDDGDFFYFLSGNSNALYLLEKNINYINWSGLSSNTNENIWKEPNGFILK